jgi:hypothetical protein
VVMPPHTPSAQANQGALRSLAETAALTPSSSMLTRAPGHSRELASSLPVTPKEAPPLITTTTTTPQDRVRTSVSWGGGRIREPGEATAAGAATPHAIPATLALSRATRLPSTPTPSSTRAGFSQATTPSLQQPTVTADDGVHAPRNFQGLDAMDHQASMSHSEAVDDRISSAAPLSATATRQVHSAPVRLSVLQIVQVCDVRMHMSSRFMPWCS